MYELKLVLIHAGRWLPLMTAHKSFKKCLLVFTTSNQLQFSPIFFVSPLDLIRNGHQPKVVLIIAGRWLPLMTPHKSFSNSVFWTKNPTRRWLVLGGQPDWPLRWLPKSKNITTMLLRSMTLNFFLYTSHWWPVCKGYQKKCCKFCDTPFIRVEYTPTPNTVNFHWTVDDAFESEPKGFWSASTYFKIWIRTEKRFLAWSELTGMVNFGKNWKRFLIRTFFVLIDTAIIYSHRARTFIIEAHVCTL
jgi:hypothetical protein